MCLSNRTAFCLYDTEMHGFMYSNKHVQRTDSLMHNKTCQLLNILCADVIKQKKNLFVINLNNHTHNYDWFKFLSEMINCFIKTAGIEKAIRVVGYSARDMVKALISVSMVTLQMRC